MNVSKQLGLIVALSLSFAAVPALGVPYSVDAAHSQVGFKVKHLFAKVPGRFTKYTASFDYDTEMKNTGNFVAEIDASSINTDNQKRDEHLKSPDFFDVAKHPKISFKSTKVTPKDKNNFTVTGELMMHGVSKPVVLAFEYLGEVKDPTGKLKAGFHATGTINRKDWGINWNKALDAGGVVVGDEVDLELMFEAENMTPAKKGA